VNALHHNDDHSVCLTVQPGQQRVREPVIETIALDVRLGIDWLLRVINNENAAAEPGQCSVDRCRSPISASGGRHLIFQTSSNAHPHFRVGPFTAALVVLGATATHTGPIGSAFYRVIEVALGGLTGLLVSLLVLPARAYALVVEAATDMLDLLARSLPELLSGLTRDLDAAQVARIQNDIAVAYQRIDAVAGEAKREHMIYLAAEPDPGPLLRALRRLRYDFIMIGRAAAVPLPQRFREPLGAPLARIGDTAVDYLRASSAALKAHRDPPPLAAVEEALDAHDAVVATLRREGTMRDLSVEAVERIYALGFALDQMRENFGDLARTVAENRSDRVRIHDQQ
jgi:uncharacterized membrane protein YccC